MRRSRPIRDFALAVTLLTALPLRVPADAAAGAGTAADAAGAEADAEAGARAGGGAPDGGSDCASYFPLVGLAFGAALLGVMWIASRFLYGLSGVAAVVLVAAGALATRLLHWDGLADVADGWFVSPERRLDVMSDSATGAFGALAVAIVALLQVQSLVEIGASPVTVSAVVLAPVFGRLAATFSAWLGKPAREGGLGRSVIGPPSAAGVAAVALAIGGAVALSLRAGCPPLVLGVIAAVGLLLALTVPHVVALRFGGVTGDTMGASVLLTETAVLVFVLLATGVLRLAGLSG